MDKQIDRPLGASLAVCNLCGEPMPEGEEMFKYHGYSCNCPKPPLVTAKPLEKLSIVSFAAGRRAGIETAAKVNDDKAREIEAWSHQDDASRLAAEMLRKAEAEIRALADEKQA